MASPITISKIYITRHKDEQWSFSVYDYDHTKNAVQSIEIHHVRRSRKDGLYYYLHEKRLVYALQSIQRDMPIGRLPKDELPRLGEVLSGVAVVNQKEVATQTWSSKDWCLDALAVLQAEGWVGSYVTREAIVQWLASNEPND